MNTNDSNSIEIDWPMLREAATKAAGRAYAPYSGLHVGAAGLSDTGTLVSGCNVENASYGLTLCAECGLVSQAHLLGVSLVALAVRTPAGEVLMPCGRCRQILLEHAGNDLLIDTVSKPIRLEQLLPSAFSSADLTDP